MSKNKHTPAAWTVNRVPIESRGGSNTCFQILPIHACLYDDGQTRQRGISEEENAANAALIASAPDLLELAERMVFYLHKQGLTGVSVEDWKDINARTLEVIARATGQEIQE